MSLRKKKKELQRLSKAFEVEADKYHDLTFSVLFVAPGWASDRSKIAGENHAIPLWQYYGKVSSDESIEKLFANVEGRDPRYGVPGAKFYAFGLFEGENIGLFLRMAKRAGNSFSDKEIETIKTKVLADLLFKDESEGKPVFVVNGNPASVWLNFVLYHSSISHPKRFSDTKVNLDPFVESLKAIDHLIEKATIERGKKSFSKIDQLRFKVALSFPGERRAYVSETANFLKDSLGKDAVFYDEDYKAQLARPNLDLLLQQIYANNSDLIVVFLCQEYDEKEWCGLEWRAIRETLKSRSDSKIMFLRFDDSDVKGAFSIDGHIDLRKITPQQAANYIFQRVQEIS